MPIETPQGIDITEIIRLGGFLYGLLALGITWFVVRTVTGTLARLGDRFTDKRLLFNQISTIGRFLLYVIGITIAVSLSIDLSQEVILALTGAAAVTVGLSLKDIAASVIAGIIIIIDRPFQVGDRIHFDGVYGEVSSIGLRSVRVVTLDDNVVTIPNNKFLNDAVSSGNWGELEMMIQLDFFVGADQDLALAKRLLEEALTTNRYAYLGKPWVVLVNQMIEGNYFAVRLRAKAYVLDVQYEKAFESDVTERVLEAFRSHGILPPAVLHRSPAGPLPSSAVQEVA